MIVLDTDILSLIQAGSGAMFERVAVRLDESGEDRVWVTVVSYEEQTRGWLAVIANARTRVRS